MILFSAVKVLVDKNVDNAVTPIPSWPVNAGYEMSPVSYDPPNDLVQHGALNFSLWQSIGEEFMVKSNVNNWIACVPNTGSLTRSVVGSVTCRLIRSITSICPKLHTTEFRFSRQRCGPALCIPISKYCLEFNYFDGCLSHSWPIHDPCADRGLNNLKDRWPQGQIWVR